MHVYCAGIERSILLLLLYLHEKGPMGGAPYTGPRLGDGLIFEVSLSQFVAKERPGKLLTLFE